VPRLDRVSCESAGVEHEHHVEAVLHRVLDQSLEVGALVRLPASLEVDVLLNERHAVIAAVLKRLRTSREESQESLAYRSGVSSGSYARIALAQSSPGWDTVRAIARALNISMAELGAAVDREG
jgi:DNA-binding XRE family transcriptional regulator